MNIIKNDICKIGCYSLSDFALQDQVEKHLNFKFLYNSAEQSNYIIQTLFAERLS